MQIRMSREHINALLQAQLTHAVIINADVSMRVIGAVESAHNNSVDAQNTARRLSEAYGVTDSFVWIDLRSATSGDD